MKKSSIFVLCIVCAFIKGIACDFISLYSKEYCINNGQSIKINLNVNNSYKTKEPSYEYQFKFDQFPEHDKTIISTSDAVEYSVIFDLFKSRSSNITVQVDVWLLGASSLKIGTVKDEKLTVCGWSTVQNNGPVTIDTPITFSVFNHYKTEVPSYEYRFKFDQFPQYDKTIVSTVNLYFEESSFISYTVTFDSLTSKAGNHTVQVDIWYCPLGVPSYSLGTVVNTFQLSDSLIGTIKYFQPIYDESLDENIISTAEYFQVKLIALVHDPRGFFLSQCQTSPTNITYEWIVNGSPQLENYHDRIIYRIFSEPQLNNISVIVTATKTIGNRLIQKSGLFNITLQSRNPITNLTIDGDTKVKESEILKLNATIHGGTPPFTFLWWISPESSINYQFNTDCEDTNESFCPITISFKEKGKKVLTFFARNVVSFKFKKLEISVY